MICLSMINELKSAIKKGFLHIFSANLINKIFLFGNSVFLVHILSKEIYGSWSYANVILKMVLLLNGLGVMTGVLQFCSSEKDEKKKVSYLKYGLKLGLSFNMLLIFLLIIISFFIPLPIKGSNYILLYLSFFPLFSMIYETILSYLRSILKNKEYSQLSILFITLYCIGTVVGGIFYSIPGVVAGHYIAYVFVILVGILLLNNFFSSFLKHDLLSSKDRIEFIKFSVVSVLTNSISQLLFLLDTFFIGSILKEQTIVASYKTATLIPSSLIFISQTIIIFVYPYFAKMNGDIKKVRDNYFKMQKYLLILNLAISLPLIIFAPLIIKIVFGEAYLDAVVPFRLLSVGYFIVGSFRIPAGNIILSMKKVKINFYNALISGILNIILDVVLILKYGVIGAATATVIIFVISSLISNGYLFIYFKQK